MQTITIGRSRSNDVVLSDMSVSRQHAQISRSDYGAFSITDCNSRNGTFVNGQRISGTVTLNENDFVRIGNNTIPWKQYFIGGHNRRDDYGNATIYGSGANPEGYQDTTENNGFAIAGFVLSFFFAVLGIVFSSIGLSKANKMNGKGKGLAVAGLVISLVSFVVGLIVYSNCF